MSSDGCKPAEIDIVQSDDGDNSIQIGDFVLETCGVSTEGIPSVGEFAKMLTFLVWMSRNTPWWIGDVISWGERRYGDDLYNHADLDPWAIDQINRHAAVCRAVPQELRNRNLWYTHHREVCKLEPEKMTEFLDMAEEQVMSSADLRKSINGVSQKKKTPRKRKPKW